MSTSAIVTGHCPKCQQNVLLTREKMDFCIALMLLIFTVGIGLILYYYAREKNRCVHCDSICQFQLPEGQKEISSNSAVEIRGRTVLNCPYCGAEVNNRNMASCPSCGSQI